MNKFHGLSFLFLGTVALYGCGPKPHPPAPVAAPSNAPADTQAPSDRDVMAQLFRVDRHYDGGAQTFFDNDLRLSQDKLAAKDIPGAKASAEDAQAVLKNIGEYVSNADYQQMQARVNAQLARIRASE